MGKSEERRPTGRPRHRWEDNIKMFLQEVVCGIELAQHRDGIELAQDRDGIELAQDRDRSRTLVTVVRNLRVP